MFVYCKHILIIGFLHPYLCPDTEGALATQATWAPGLTADRVLFATSITEGAMARPPARAQARPHANALAMLLQAIQATAKAAPALTLELQQRPS